MLPSCRTVAAAAEASIDRSLEIASIEAPCCDQPASSSALPEILESGVFDGLFFGPTDMAVALGHPGDPGHPDVAEALDSATGLILGHGTSLGIFCATADEARQWASRGLTLLAISTDLGMLRGAAVSALGQLRAQG